MDDIVISNVGIEKEDRKPQRRGNTPPPEEPQKQKQPGQGGSQRQQPAHGLRGVASGPELLAVNEGPHGAGWNPWRSDRIGARPQAGRDEPLLLRIGQQPRRHHHNELSRPQPVRQQNRRDPQRRQQPPDWPAFLERHHEKDQHQRQQRKSGDVRPLAIEDQVLQAARPPGASHVSRQHRNQKRGRREERVEKRGRGAARIAAGHAQHQQKEGHRPQCIEDCYRHVVCVRGGEACCRRYGGRQGVPQRQIGVLEGNPAVPQRKPAQVAPVLEHPAAEGDPRALDRAHVA